MTGVAKRSEGGRGGIRIIGAGIVRRMALTGSENGGEWVPRGRVENVAKRDACYYLFDPVPCGTNSQDDFQAIPDIILDVKPLKYHLITYACLPVGRAGHTSSIRKFLSSRKGKLST